MNERTGPRAGGDIITGGSKITVTAGGSITNSFNQVSTVDPDVAEALKQLGAFIQRSGNAVAADAFDRLQAEIASAAPRKPFLQSFWKTIKDELPAVTQLADVALKIAAVVL